MQINRIHISDIADARRMDPIFFRFGTARFGHTFKLASIGSVVIDMQSGFGAGKGDQAGEEDGIIHIRPTNIDNEGNLIFEKNVYVPSNLKKQMLSKGDVLFNNTNSQELVGKTAILKEERDLFFSNHITRIRVDQQRIMPEFIWIILNLYQQEKIFYSICTNWNNQSGVGLELLKSLKIPLPPMEVQREIVELYTKAQVEKQTKEAQAKALLDSIDSYLLTELGITLPQTPKRQLAFKVQCSDILGQRLDASFYKDKFELISEKYQNKKLSDVLIINPSVNLKSFNDNNEITFIPMEVVDEVFGTIVENRTTTISNTKGFTKFEDNDLLWAKITPCMQNGKSAIARNLKNGKGCGSTEFYVLRPKDPEISIEYIYLLLRHHKVLESAKNSFGGSAGQQRVSSGYLKSISIPTPPIEVQRNLVAAIELRKTQAKQLQAEALQTIAIAKQKIEKIILG